MPDCRIEVLIPDFKGDEAPLRTVLDARPGRAEPQHRDRAAALPDGALRRQATRARWSCSIARAATRPDIPTKTGIMVGLGEEHDELVQVFRDLRKVGVAILTIGQYLRPSADHAPMIRYYHPDEFPS